MDSYIQTPIRDDGDHFKLVLCDTNYILIVWCGEWLNFLNLAQGKRKRKKKAIETVYKKLNRGILKHIALYQWS